MHYTSTLSPGQARSFCRARAARRPVFYHVRIDFEKLHAECQLTTHRCRAGRIVTDLGLHLDPSALIDQGYISRLDGYVRCRTFWGVWTLDKEFGALLGRPATLVNTCITCPQEDWCPEDDFVSRVCTRTTILLLIMLALAQIAGNFLHSATNRQ